MKTREYPFAVLSALALVTSLFAQVSPKSPSRESTTSIIVEGSITKVEITTPHVNLYVNASTSDSGKVVTWAIETGSLNELSAKSITRTDLKLGRVVRARGTLGPGENKIIAPVSEISFPQ